MPCRQASTYNGVPASSGGHATLADCLQACKEGACCEGTTCSIKPQCQCQGAGQTFKGVGTTCTPNPCFCNCPQACTLGMQFVSPAQGDIGVCGPYCAPISGPYVNTSCPPVTNTISDSGIEDSPEGRVIVSYTTTLDAVGDSTNFRNGITKQYTRLFLDSSKSGLRSSVYASFRYDFVYVCSDSGTASPFLYARASLGIAYYPGFFPGNFRYGQRGFLKAANFEIDPTFYRCSPSAGRLCPVGTSGRVAGFNPTATKEFLPDKAVFDFSENAINNITLTTLESSQVGEQSLIGQVYADQFSEFTARLIFSERNICNPLP